MHPPGESVFGSGQQTINAERHVQNEISVLESDAVYARLKQNLGLDDDPPGVSGRGFADADVITVSVQSGDRQTAATLANAYVDAYIDVKRDQAVKGIAAASAELQTKVTDLQNTDRRARHPDQCERQSTTIRGERPIDEASSTSRHCSVSASINCRSMRRCRPATPNCYGRRLHRSSRSSPRHFVLRHSQRSSACCSASARHSWSTTSTIP